MADTEPSDFPKAVSILGPGLIGGSIALALKEKLPSTSIRLWARRQTAVDEVLEMGITPTATTDLKVALDQTELVIICTPIDPKLL